MGCTRYVLGSHIKCAVKETEWEVRCCTDLSFLPVLVVLPPLLQNLTDGAMYTAN